MMNFKTYLLVLFIGLFNSINAQTNNKKDQSLDSNKALVYKYDIIGNLYVAGEKSLKKYDTNGVVLYYQSIKSIGGVSSIIPINSMSILLFSEEQQTVTTFDNTLTVLQTLELGQLGFGYVTMIAASSQMNKLWVYDQLNSKLVLIDRANTKQSQEISNLRGLVNSVELIEMVEKDNYLFITDLSKNVYQFDKYGSLIKVIRPDK
ncbi:MAG: DNA-binding beta-propeller fold protein YncE [Psychromonas sp.]|jgi:DNA-binding beta-propeller fold protein YncE